MRIINPGALLALGLLTVVACTGSVETPSGSSSGGGGSTSSTSSTTSSWSGTSSTSNGGAASCEDPAPSTGNAPYVTAWAMALGNATTPIEVDFIAADAAGEVLVSGGIGGVLDFGGGVILAGDGRFLARLDADGHTQWAKLLDDPLAHLVVDRAGALWTWGSTDAGPYVQKHEGGVAALFSLPLAAKTVSPTGDGGAVIAVEFYEAFSYGGQAFKAAYGDVAVLRVDAAGALVWATTLAASLPPLAPPPAKEEWIMNLMDVAATSDGGAALAAYVVKPDPKTGDKRERVLLMLDGSGKASWLSHTPSQAASPTLMLSADSSGGVLLVTLQGSNEENDLGCGTHYSSGFGMELLDAGGQRRWERFFEGEMGLSRPSFDPAGNIVVAGEFEGAVDLGGGPLDGNPSYFSIMVARYSPAGVHLASKAYRNGAPDPSWLGPGECRADAATVDPWGNVLLSGYYSGALAFDGSALPSVPNTEGPYLTNGLIAKLVTVGE
jgi:hypothetical protein